MPFGLQPMHLILILIAALILFGPKRLPELGKGMGKAIQEFMQAIRQNDSAVEKAKTPPAPDDRS